MGQAGGRKNHEYDYTNFRVLVAAVSTNYKKEPAYKYVSSKFYLHDYASNHLDLDLSGLPANRYMVRFLADTEKEVEFSFGYYSPDNFDVRIDATVDDGEFVSKTLLSRARSVVDQKRKKKLPKDIAKGWVCIENIP